MVGAAPANGPGIWAFDPERGEWNVVDLHSTGAFGDDDGRTPAEVQEVLVAHAHGRVGMRAVVQVLARHRLLVPLLEVDAAQLPDDDSDPCAGQDKAVAAVSVRTDLGTVGLAFTGMAALLAWNPAARPMPTDSTRVAAALVAEGGIGLVVDPGSPTGARIDRPALDRLAHGGVWPEPWCDEQVRDVVLAELAPALASGDLRVRLGPGPAEVPSEQPGLTVSLRFPDGTASEVRAARAGVVAERLGRSADLRSVFDGVLAIEIAPV